MKLPVLATSVLLECVLVTNKLIKLISITYVIVLSFNNFSIDKTLMTAFTEGKNPQNVYSSKVRGRSNSIPGNDCVDFSAEYRRGNLNAKTESTYYTIRNQQIERILAVAIVCG